MELEQKRFGRLVVIGHVENRGKRKYWLCSCDCGVTKFIGQDNLISGQTKSCGCLRREATSARVKTHGMTGSPTYIVWQRIKQRCYYAGAINYERYGGRGISVCARWRESFENFLTDMGKVPGKGYSIERIDNNGNYTPENCRWATPQEQARNTRRNRLIKHDGKTLTLVEWSKITGLNRTTIAARLDRGWTARKALTTPVLRRKKGDNKWHTVFSAVVKKSNRRVTIE